MIYNSVVVFFCNDQVKIEFQVSGGTGKDDQEGGAGGGASSSTSAYDNYDPIELNLSLLKKSD